MTRPVIVALEGIDGAGKSTLAQRLLNLDWGPRRVACCATPASALHDVCFSVRGTNSEASFLAFMLGNVAAIDAIADADVVIVDRYLLSTIVHHQAPCLHWRDSLRAIVGAMKLVLPDLTVLLHVDTGVACARLSQRADDSPLLVALDIQQEVFERMLADPEMDGLFGRALVLQNESEEHGRIALETIRNEVLAVMR